MNSCHWRRWGTAALLVVGLFAVAVGSAHAGDDEAPESATAAATTTVVVTKNGTKTIRLVQDKDGRFILVAPDGPTNVRERVVEQIVKDHRAAAHTTFGEMVEVDSKAKSGAHPDNPMSSVMKWMMRRHGDYAGGNDPITAWFQGGSDVPLADLRDTLVADGWTASSLLEWLHQDLSGALAALLAPVLGDMAHGGGAHGMGPHGMPPHGMGPHGTAPRGHGEGMHRGGRGMGAHGAMGPHGDMGPRGRRGPGRARSAGPARAIVLWNDGSGWHGHEVDGMGMGRAAPGPRRGMGRQAHGRMQAAERGDCNCPDCPKRGRHGRGMGRGSDLEGLPPALRRVIEESMTGRRGAMIFPGDVRVEHEVGEAQLEDLLGQLGVMMPTVLRTKATKAGCGGDCSSCPNKSQCADGSCGDKAGPRKPGCCGQCDGDCENCPCRDGGKNCGDDCGCKSSAAQGCCGTCDGDCDACPCDKGACDKSACDRGACDKGACDKGSCDKPACDKPAGAKGCCGTCGGKASAPK